MTRGKPLSFDRDQALERAMEFFWNHGYEASGMTDLLEHMGIGRQSLYDTFGDKHSLFVEAIKHYNQRMTHELVSQLNGDGSPLERIRKAVTSIATP